MCLCLRPCQIVLLDAMVLTHCVEDPLGLLFFLAAPFSLICILSVSAYAARVGCSHVFCRLATFQFVL